MIFYFTSTGNSLYAAKRLSEVTGDKLISIADSLKTSTLYFELKDGERVGFVFPTHSWGSPSIVDAFISKLKLSISPDLTWSGSTLDDIYTYGVITYGTSCGKSPDDLRHALEQKGMSLDYVAAVKMVDNYILGANIPSENKQTTILARADMDLDTICTKVIYRRSGTNYRHSSIPLISTYAKKIFKKYGARTEPFWVQNTCDGCGICKEVCPIDAIEIKSDRHPIWVKDNCTLCLRCLHRCPKYAIEYGKKTQNRKRYYNPLA